MVGLALSRDRQRQKMSIGDKFNHIHARPHSQHSKRISEAWTILFRAAHEVMVFPAHAPPGRWVKSIVFWKERVKKGGGMNRAFLFYCREYIVVYHFFFCFFMWSRGGEKNLHRIWYRSGIWIFLYYYFLFLFFFSDQKEKKREVEFAFWKIKKIHIEIQYYKSLYVYIYIYIYFIGKKIFIFAYLQKL